MDSAGYNPQEYPEQFEPMPYSSFLGPIHQMKSKFFHILIPQQRERDIFFLYKTKIVKNIDQVG
jgi:hypothetical protein